MKKIKLTQGLFALVDDEDFEYLNQWKWYAAKMGNSVYALRRIRENGIQTGQQMHCQIMGCKWIDHIDGNGLNCQKYNLRKCNQQQNNWNRKPLRVSTSIYKGVSFNKDSKKWVAGIKKDGIDIHLGYHINEIEAAKIYDKKALEIFGEFAYLNFKEP